MVSFSCDACQNVFTKPKVERHFQNCSTRSVSCIDCSAVFNARTVREHKSCITEEEKYGPKTSTACTQTYCGICKLRLNGAVHALQHYESKKHKAAERRQKAAGLIPADAEKESQTKKNRSNGDVGGPTGLKQPKDSDSHDNSDSGKQKGRAVERNQNHEKQGRPKGLRRIMKKILKNAPKQRLKRDRLVKAVARELGAISPEDLGKLVDRKAEKSNAFKVRNSRISLTTVQSS